MELADLKTLLAVVEHGGITKAAKALNRVPSGVTTRIIQLEEYLGVQLFLREKKRLLITPKGSALCEYANRILHLAHEAELLVRSAEPCGKLRLGAMESTAASRLPKPLARLHTRYPLLHLELATGPSRFLYEQVLANRLDAAFTADTCADGRLERLPLWTEELVLVAHAAHPPIREPSNIVDKTMLVFRDGCSYRNRMLRWFSACGRTPERIAELASYHAIMGAAAAGMGVGIVPVSVTRLCTDTDALSTHPLAAPFNKTVTELIWRKDIPSPNLNALRESLEPCGA